MELESVRDQFAHVKGECFNLSRAIICLMRADGFLPLEYGTTKERVLNEMKERSQAVMR